LEEEQNIRQVIADWMTATVAGDLDKIRSLMTEDVVFLTCGNPPMRGREPFLATQREMLGHVRIQPKSEIQEIRVSGDLAYCWTHLDVEVVPISGGSPIKRGGHTLTVLRKNEAGHWQVWRDANLLGEVE
jgi:uncharacterized protein (TIGR02246 family)